MVQVIDAGKADLVAFKISGSLDKEDYTLLMLIPAMEEKISRFGKISLFWEMVNPTLRKKAKAMFPEAPCACEWPCPIVSGLLWLCQSLIPPNPSDS